MVETQKCVRVKTAQYQHRHWGLQGKILPAELVDPRETSFFFACTWPDKKLGEKRLEEDLNPPEDQGQDLAGMLGPCVIAAWEKSWATLISPEGELFLYFFPHIAKDLKQVSDIVQPKPFILHFTSSWFIENSRYIE